MDENELREMDVKVHKALYPGWRIEKREWTHGIDYRAILPGDGPNTWLKDIPLPWYSTDIQDWEPVYALKPGWLWSINELVECVWVTLRVMGRPYDVVYSTVATTEATGLAAYALGRARCVIAWAEGREER
jgi:hypothetical protein